MEFSVIAAMLASTVAGGVVASVCGFGFGVVVMAIWPYFLPYAQSVAVSALCGVSTAVMIAIPHWKHINFKTLLPCALSGLIASALSVHFSAGAADKLMIHALGWVLIAVSIYNVFLGGKMVDANDKSIAARVQELKKVQLNPRNEEVYQLLKA